MSELDASQWDTFLSRYPHAHLLQTGEWGELKSSFGWLPVRLVSGEAGAQLLFRRLPLGMSMAYLPKGPLGQVGDLPFTAGQNAILPYDHPLWAEIDAVCRVRRAVFLKLEPDAWDDLGDPTRPPPGYRPSPQTIQPPRTLLVDLRGGEEAVLMRMKQKTRYNIRLAVKKGVAVRPSANLEIYHRLMQVTGERDRFGVHSREYYQRAYDLFHPRGACELMVAEAEGQPLAALMVFAHGRRAWYFYGASSDDHRDWMPAYLLQWEAMRWAMRCGCQDYDLWGVPDADEETLEAGFTQRADGLWGVYRFKRGFGGELRRSPGPWDRVYRPEVYWLYRLWARGRRQE
jgi:lipid II:glycine glycyltransferase (peptidoglycan interpeptide bridge formation enzyme)